MSGRLLLAGIAAVAILIVWYVAKGKKKPPPGPPGPPGPTPPGPPPKPAPKYAVTTEVMPSFAGTYTLVSGTEKNPVFFGGPPGAQRYMYQSLEEGRWALNGGMRNNANGVCCDTQGIQSWGPTIDVGPDGGAWSGGTTVTLI
jgi:hypothetical protein